LPERSTGCRAILKAARRSPIGIYYRRISMTGDLLLVLGAAGASAVEAVEAVTIVLALGATRGWRSPLLGAGAAVGALAILVAVLGPALATIPIDSLRLVVGSLLLIFGLQWLRKAILRASGFKAIHDEDRVYAEEVAHALAAGAPGRRIDGYAFTVSFKSVLLEGLEIAFIVLTLGASHGSTALAAAGALVAVAGVVTVAAAVRRPLSRVPENRLAFAVGVMLSAFGLFWATEGVGVDWPGGDAAILGLVIVTAAWALAFVVALGRRRVAQELPA
jgi:uncharacterized membrane protein